MEKIIRVHFDHARRNAARTGDAGVLLAALDRQHWRKKPSTSELVDWLRALELGGVDPARIAKDIPFAGVLLKKDKDITAMQRRMTIRTPCLSGFFYLLRSAALAFQPQ